MGELFTENNDAFFIGKWNVTCKLFSKLPIDFNKNIF